MSDSAQQQVPKGYKQTEVGIIPEGWEVESLKNITGPERKITYGIVVPGPHVSNGVPLIRAQDYSRGWVDIDELYRVSPAIDKSYKRSRVVYGDILLTIVGSVGNLAKVLTAFAGSNITQQTARLSFNPKKANADFYFNLLQSTSGKKEIINYTKSGVQPSLNLSDVDKFLVPLPSLNEQTAIANALSDVDALIGSLEKLIAKKRAIKTAAMQQLLTGKKRLPPFDQTHTGYKPTDLGEIPNDWDMVTLGDAAKVNMGQSPDGYFYNNKGLGLPLVQGNADVYQRKTIIRNYTSQLTKLAKKGEIILSVRAPVGEVAIATFDCCIGRGVCSIKYENNFLYHWLIFYEDQWHKLSKGSTFDSVNSDEVRNLLLPLPNDKKEQIGIADVLDSVDKELEALEQRLNKTQQLKQGMMQELLTGRTRLV